MHAYSSSKEAVKSSLRVEWLDHKSERDQATAADLVTLVKELLAAQQAAASKFEAFGIDNIQNKPKKGDSGCNGANPTNCQRGWDYKALQQTNKYTTARDNTQGKLDLKLAKLTDCNATRFNTSSFELTEIDYCGKEWDASEAARGEAYVAQHTLATYLNAYVAAVGKDAMKSGITEEKRAEFNKLNEDFAKVVARSQAQTAELQIELDRHSLDYDIAGCDGNTEDANCEDLKNIKAMLEDLIKSNKELAVEQEGTASNAKVSASAAGAPPEDDNMMMIIIIAAAAVVVLLVCVAAVMLMGGGKNNNKGDDQRNVVAFENPMSTTPTSSSTAGTTRARARATSSRMAHGPRSRTLPTPRNPRRTAAGCTTSRRLRSVRSVAATSTSSPTTMMTRTTRMTTTMTRTRKRTKRPTKTAARMLRMTTTTTTMKVATTTMTRTRTTTTTRTTNRAAHYSRTYVVSCRAHSQPVTRFPSATRLY